MLRHDRTATVRSLVDGLTDESLAADTTPVDGSGWPPAQSFPVRDCLLNVLKRSGTTAGTPSGISTS